MSLHPNKKPFRVLRSWNDNGNRHVEYEADFWEGPTGDDTPVGYCTVRSTVSARTVRNDCSPSVSYWPDLKKALGV
jgi:hypothetical protein